MIYRQFMEQVRRMVSSGQVQPGNELPSVHVLAMTVSSQNVSKDFMSTRLPRSSELLPATLATLLNIEWVARGLPWLRNPMQNARLCYFIARQCWLNLLLLIVVSPPPTTLSPAFARTGFGLPRQFARLRPINAGWLQIEAHRHPYQS